MTRRRASMSILVPVLFIACISLYILAGVRSVPFHGDEATIIYMGRDWYFIRAGQIDQMLYRNPAPDGQYAADQELRMVNGTLSPLIYGVLSDAFSYNRERIHTQWQWGADFNWNQATGKVPPTDLLFGTRWIAALLLCLSAAVVIAIGRLIHRRVGLISGIVFALMPNILMNGRRAMFEAGMLLTLTLMLWIALRIVKWTVKRLKLRRDDVVNTRDMRWVRIIPLFVLFGFAVGFALTAKHTNVIPLAAIIVSMGLALLVFAPIFARGNRWAIVWLFTGMLVSGVIAVGVFYTLNPSWYGNPVAAAEQVNRYRTRLLTEQTVAFDGYPDWGARAQGFITYTFADPQYYEVRQGWPQWIGSEIVRYESTILEGAHFWPLTLLGIAAGIGIALFSAIRRREVLPIVIAIAWILVSVALILATPVPWARYYLPLAPFTALLIGVAANWLITVLPNLSRSRIRAA